MKNERVKVSDVKEGERYHFEGNIQNGNFVTREKVTRRVTWITDKEIRLECGRHFIIDKDLIITKVD